MPRTSSSDRFAFWFGIAVAVLASYAAFHVGNASMAEDMKTRHDLRASCMREYHDDAFCSMIRN